MNAPRPKPKALPRQKKAPPKRSSEFVEDEADFVIPPLEGADRTFLEEEDVRRRTFIAGLQTTLEEDEWEVWEDDEVEAYAARQMELSRGAIEEEMIKSLRDAPVSPITTPTAPLPPIEHVEVELAEPPRQLARASREPAAAPPRPAAAKKPAKKAVAKKPGGKKRKD
jgi:hypothetical protein